ncbi:sugar kinase [Microbacterium keratanolyticum]|uniref:Sugar kinase n=1 Tax=Microbacterium keratanolyticum TaxID=67574 RepID=A0A9W6HQS4_9MICO|nr:sugar kinase [Microbacterium keratanolyticum]
MGDGNVFKIPWRRTADVCLEDSVTRFALAVDVGGTKIEAALVSEQGAVIEGTRSRRATGPTATPDDMRAAIAAVVDHALSSDAARGGTLLGAGVGSAGPIDKTTGTIHPVNMVQLRGFPLEESVRNAASASWGSDVHTVFAHDGGCLALAESWLGATRDARVSFSMVVSTGIGGGFVHDGRYAPGASGNGGHIGQMRGGEGLRLEPTASGPASAAWARTQGWTGETGEDLARDAAAGDPIARAAIERSARAVGAALADAVTLVDVDMVAIGGGFSHVSEDYVDLVHAALVENAVLDYAARVQVVRAGLGGDGPLIGAAALILRQG